MASLAPARTSLRDRSHAPSPKIAARRLADTHRGDAGSSGSLRCGSVRIGSLAGRRASPPPLRLPLLRPPILLLDAGVDLLAVHLDLGWSLDTELHLSGSHLEHGDLDRIPDSDVFA